jgi:hypothetical protein
MDGNTSETGGAGYFDAVVPPGESIELTLALPALKKPGKYRLTVDMGDEARGWFFMVGSPTYTAELEVR